MSDMTLEQFSEKAIHRPGIELYSIDDAIELVKLCQKKAIPVLGIDGFKIYGKKIQPSMENSIDLSDQNESYGVALSFLHNRHDLDLLYEIVY